VTAQDTFNRVKGDGSFAFILALVMWAIDFFVPQWSFTGLIFTKDLSFYGQFFMNSFTTLLPIILGLIVWFYVNNGNHSRNAMIQLIILAIMISLIAVYGGPRSVLHIVLPWLIVWSIPQSYMSQEDKYSWLMRLYFLDFIGHGLINLMLPKDFAAVFGNNLVFPVWVFFTAQWAGDLAGGGIYRVVNLIMILFIVSYFLYGIMNYNMSKSDVEEARKGFFGVVSVSWDNMMNSLSQSANSFTQLFNQSYYDDGEQEKTEDPQGLYLKEIARGEIEYREGDAIHLWARLEAKTLEKEIEAKVICYTEIDDDFGTRIIKGIVDEESKATEETFTVISGVERSIPCIFEGGLPVGEHDIIYNATFTFTTESTKKIYMMDRKRLLNDLQLLADKGGNPTMADVLRDLYQITDTEPKSIFTSGPVKLSIGTDKVPWDIGEKNNIKPLFGVTIENNWQKGGMIKSIEGLYLKMPDSFSFASLERSCTFPLSSLSTEPDYRVYAVNPNKEMTDIEDYISVDCHMVIDPGRSLDNTPVTTRFLKAAVDYTYLMQEEITVEVKTNPVFAAQEELAAREEKLCCEIVTPTDRRHVPVDTEAQCRAYAGGGAQASIVDLALCS
jgi:hypothetical protein